MPLRKISLALIFLSLLIAPLARAQRDTSVEIDLQQQTAYLLQGRQIVMTSPLSTGRSGHLTETGSFKVIEKERNHFSTLYGKIVDASGRTIVKDADADMRVPRGGKFIPAPMRYFMRFHAATGMHAGYLPGYPASHGCVRMPEENAIAFFNAVEVGTPVHVFGRPPRQDEYRAYGPQPTRRIRPDLRYRNPRAYDTYALPPPDWWR